MPRCFPFRTKVKTKWGVVSKEQRSFINCPCHVPGQEGKLMSSTRAMRIILGQLTMSEFTGAMPEATAQFCKPKGRFYDKAMCRCQPCPPVKIGRMTFEMCRARQAFDRAMSRLLSGQAAILMLK